MNQFLESLDVYQNENPALTQWLEEAEASDIEYKRRPKPKQEDKLDWL